MKQNELKLFANITADSFFNDILYITTVKNEAKRKTFYITLWVEPVFVSTKHLTI